MKLLLFEAIKFQRMKTIHVLLSQRLDLNVKNLEGNSFLHMAVLCQHEEIVNLLISAGIDVNLRNNDDETALQLAFCCNDLNKMSIMKTLIAAGSNIKVTDKKTRNTLLHEAVKFRDADLVNVLICGGLNVNAQNFKGFTPLHVAVKSSNRKLTKILIDAGADVNLRNNDGLSALDIVFRTSMVLGLEYSISKMLVKAGADEINMRNIDTNMSLLHVAADACDIDFVRLLIARGVNVNEKNELDDWTALHYVAENINSEDPSIFEVLLSANADINSKTKTDHETPLHRLIVRDRPPINLFKILKVFLKYGVDLNAEDVESRTPLTYALDYSNVEALSALVKCAGVDINSVNPTCNETILHTACDHADLRTIKFLLKNGANINVLDSDEETPLHLAAEIVTDQKDKKEIEKAMEILKYLLKWDPDVNIVSRIGRNILMPKISEEVLQDCLWKSLVEHLSKLRANSRTLNSSLLDTIRSNPDYEEYFARCNEELEIAKSTKFHSDSWVSFFNLLMDDKKKLLQYVGNKNLVESFVKTEFIKKFPIYGPLILERFSKAFEKRLIQDQAAKTLSHLLPVDVDPTNRIVVRILSFLKMIDLQYLVD